MHIRTVHMDATHMQYVQWTTCAVLYYDPTVCPAKVFKDRSPPCPLKSSELTIDCRKVVLKPGKREGFSFIRKSAIVSL